MRRFYAQCTEWSRIEFFRLPCANNAEFSLFSRQIKSWETRAAGVKGRAQPSKLELLPVFHLLEVLIGEWVAPEQLL